MASRRNGTLYIGVTNNLERRVFEHKNNKADSFTKKYHIYNLVWYDTTNSIESAITREKQIKKWNRKWKLELIEEKNLLWKDLSL